ncbi:PEP-CTERM sorting domain-containing protein [Methylophilus sp. QUAN]|uniref:PEP-CTERM sorting domain-containing protein n=1 Tax=Methylophilus sp. QUAN TaxID=2781020 RepID=UPI00188E6B52|nr:PEP-CTERM sorting domain-containing protein [Methylophilus sp. QUAN]MBF4990447.1 PEP-CTERM sorting domain-containing protein [Methylophilus sp. QUAN]
MKLKGMLLASLFAVAANTASAGNFQSLTTNVVDGDNDAFVDSMFILATDVTYAAGYADTTEFQKGGSGNVVPTSLTYRAFPAFDIDTELATGTLSLIDWRVTTGVDLAPGSAQADIYDFVFRDSADNSLVFGTRYLNRDPQETGDEVNFLYRYGFTGYSTSVAWTFLTDSDLRQYTAIKTDSTAGEGPFDYDVDVVRQQGDFSVSEDNPWSGLYLVKTDATTYSLGKAIGFYQTGEEGQTPAGGFITGFIPTAVTTPVPEPESYVMLLAGLGVAGIASRRRHSKAAK